jgi:hypothetical protein
MEKVGTFLELQETILQDRTLNHQIRDPKCLERGVFHQVGKNLNEEKYFFRRN